MTIKLYTGPMKSGKSKSLVDMIDYYKSHNKHIEVVKPQFDNNPFRTRSGFTNIPTKFINGYELYDLICDVIVIDEIQFFQPSVVEILQELSAKGMIIIAAGLDLKHNFMPFTTTMRLMPYCDEIIKLSAICESPGCYKPARYTLRLSGNDKSFELDTGDNYTVRCEEHKNDPLPQKQSKTL